MQRKLTPVLSFLALLCVTSHIGVVPLLLVDALPCNCNNGIIVESAPRCKCECLSSFQLPDCDYAMAEEVRLDVYLNMPAQDFQSSIFLQQIEKGTLLEPGTTQYLYSVNLDKFNKTNVLIKMPGYGVRRFMPMIDEQDVWVQKARIEAAYVIPWPQPITNLAKGLPTFDYNGYTITVDSLLWLIGAFVVTFFIVCCEACCCLKNDEDTIHDLGYAPDEQKKMDKYNSPNAHLDGKAWEN